MNRDKFRVYEVSGTIADEGTSTTITLPAMSGNMVMLRGDVPALTTDTHVSVIFRYWPNDEIVDAGNEDDWCTFSNVFASNTTTFAKPADATQFAAGQSIPIYNYGDACVEGEQQMDIRLLVVNGQSGAKTVTLFLYIEEA